MFVLEEFLGSIHQIEGLGWRARVSDDVIQEKTQMAPPDNDGLGHRVGAHNSRYSHNIQLYPKANATVMAYTQDQASSYFNNVDTVFCLRYS